jgi:hypothetical protein
MSTKIFVFLNFNLGGGGTETQQLPPPPRPVHACLQLPCITKQRNYTCTMGHLLYTIVPLFAIYVVFVVMDFMWITHLINEH